MRRSVGSSVWSVLALVVAGVAMQAAGPVETVVAAPPGALVAGVETPTNIGQLVGFTGRMASDTSGNVYVATGAQIWKVNGTTGALTLIAGTGELGYSGDGGPATAARLSFPSALAVGSNGSVYFFDSYRIRRVTAAGTISSIAGTGVAGIGFDNAPAVSQPIEAVSAIAIDSNQNVFFTQTASSFVGVRKVSATTGDLLNAVAGFPATSTCSGLTGPPGSVVLGNGALQLAIDRTFDEIYVAGTCSIGGVVVRITAGSSTLIAGGGASAPSGGLNALSARLPSYLTDIGLLPAGELHYAANGQLWRISVGELWQVAASSGTCLFSDGAGAADVCPSAFEFGSAGSLYVAFTGRLGRLGPSVLDDLTPGLSPADGVAATSVGLPNLYDLAVRGDGEVYYTAGTTGYLRSVTTAGVLATKAGNGDPLATPSFGGAAIGSPIGYQQMALDTDSAGNLYATINAEYVAKVTPAGTFVKVAGTGVYGNGPDGPSATTTAVAPIAVAATDTGTVYLLGTNVVTCGGTPCGTGQVVRRIDPGGAISTLWSSTSYSYPYQDLAVAPDGTVVLMTRTGDLHRLAPSTGVISTIPFAGTGPRMAIRVDDLGVIYVATDVAVRTTGPTGGAITTAYAYASPGQFMTIDIDATGALYVLHDGMIRKVAQTPGAPTNVAAATAAAGTSATVSWAAPARTGGTTLTGFRVERSADAGSTWQSVGVVPASPTTVTGLTAGTPYRFRVAAVNAVGSGPVSTAVAPVDLPSGSDLASLPAGLEVSDSTPAPSQALTISADGFTPFEWVAVVLQSTPTLIGSVQADATGAVHASLALPPGTPAGAHTLALVGDSSGNGYRAAVTVVAVDDGLAQPTPPPATFTALSPVRLFETRPGEPAGVVAVPVGRVGGSSVLRVRVTGVAGVPSSGVGAVSLNVTAVDPVADGFVTVWPCGDRPLAANVNFVRGEIVPNAVIAPVSSSGEVCFYAMADTFLVADINGWFAADAGFAALSPVRLFETRPGEPAGVVAVPVGRVGGSSVLRVKVTGVAGVPSSGVGAVSLNVTAVDPVADGFVTVWPCGDRPLAANVNFVRGEIVPNAVIAPVSSSGEVCFYAMADTFLVADINGWFAADAGFAALSPVRLFETRPSDPQGVVPVVQQRYGGSSVLRVKVTGVAGVPSSGVGAVSLNVTAVDPVADGFVTVWPCGDRPLAANVNFVRGEIVPNAVIAPVSSSGEVCFYAMADTFLVGDINGWFERHG